MFKWIVRATLSATMAAVLVAFVLLIALAIYWTTDGNVWATAAALWIIFCLGYAANGGLDD